MSAYSNVRRLRTDEHGVYTPPHWTPLLQMDMEELARLRKQREVLEQALAVLIEHDLKPGREELVAGIVKLARAAEPIEQRLKEAP